MIDDDRLARQALAAIPAFAADAQSALITPLKGLTNQVFRIEAESGSYALRLPGPGTASIIDRRVEEINGRAAAEVGIAPEMLYFGADGVMITQFIEGETLSPSRFSDNPTALERAADALRRLHNDCAAFAREFRVFDIMENYTIILMQRGPPLADNQLESIRLTQEVREVIRLKPVQTKPCHCDPTGANLIDNGKRMWLIDWEYSGMNDPAWDLAYLSIEADLDPASDQRLLTLYFGRVPGTTELARMRVYKALCQHLSALWAMIQHVNGNRSADFLGYAEATFERCRARMLALEFSEDVEAIRRG